MEPSKDESEGQPQLSPDHLAKEAEYPSDQSRGLPSLSEKGDEAQQQISSSNLAEADAPESTKPTDHSGKGDKTQSSESPHKPPNRDEAQSRETPHASCQGDLLQGSPGGKEQKNERSMDQLGRSTVPSVAKCNEEKNEG